MVKQWSLFAKWTAGEGLSLDDHKGPRTGVIQFKWVDGKGGQQIDYWPDGITVQGKHDVYFVETQTFDGFVKWAMESVRDVGGEYLLMPGCPECGTISNAQTADCLGLYHSHNQDKSSLVEHAKRELELSGQTAEDSAYAASIVAAVAAFALYGHSGGSAGIAIMQLHKLLQFRTLSPLTSDPDEWVDQGGPSGYPLWQNKRDSAAFSKDAGKTWYYVDDRG